MKNTTKLTRKMATEFMVRRLISYSQATWRHSSVLLVILIDRNIDYTTCLSG